LKLGLKEMRYLRFLFSWKAYLIWFMVISGLGLPSIDPARASEGRPRQALYLPENGKACDRTGGNPCKDRVKDRESFLLPDLQTLPPFDFRLIEYGGTENRVIRFANSVWNSGEGVLELHGEYDRNNGSIRFRQLLYGEGEETLEHRVGEFTFHREHNHWHWEDFSVYEIWRLAPDGSLGEILVTSGKVGYCMLDIRRVPEEEIASSPIREAEIPETRQYRGCGWRLQGISVGWVDTYFAHTPGQVMDISGLRDGIYAFRSTVDPEGNLVESDEDNNSMTVYFSLYGNQFRLMGETLLRSCLSMPATEGESEPANHPCK
jgi:hypothetical protein